MVLLTADVPTSLVPFIETEHGRLRRRQRGIDKKDLQAAMKHGEKTISSIRRPNGDRVAIYKYKHIVYIVNDKTGEEVTCYALPLDLERVPLKPSDLTAHQEAERTLQANYAKWTSNTVVVVDTSGSMGNHDVWGTKTRLDAVWLSLALDFVAHRLESGAAGLYDVVSVVSLGTESSVVIREQPTSWILYNQIVDFYQKKVVPPGGHGNYIPSLEEAKRLLTRNSCASCATALLFLSDGKPSDLYGTRGFERSTRDQLILDTVKSLAERFGRRLTFSTIGIGDPDDFDTLRAMADAAADYGVQASFELPSMTSSCLGNAFSTVSSTLTSTQTEMTDLETLTQQKVRNVIRESRRKASESIKTISPEDYYLYPLHRVQRRVFKEWYEDRMKVHSYELSPLQDSRATYVAINKAAFGEGAERFAFRFFEIDRDGRTILGKPLVAKESRMVLADDSKAGRTKFVRTFCHTQQLARRIAEEFNRKLNSLRRVHKATPRVTFLDCSVYELEDKNLGKQEVLVEEKLDHTKWKKYNSNNGFVSGMKEMPTFSVETMRNAMEKLATVDLGAIEEEDESEEEEEEEEEESGKASGDVFPPICFSPEEVAQAFSHFSYKATGRKRLICDLQGVYDESQNILRFSDPVIHYHNPAHARRAQVHGRTDRGQKGVLMFFETHKEYCGHLCRLVNGGFKKHNNNLRNNPSFQRT